MKALKAIADKYNSASLIFRIFIGIVTGIILALIFPNATWISTLGDLFVGALKSIAPVLVAVLVSSSLCQGTGKLDRRFGMVILFYMLTTFLAAFVAVIVSFMFPVNLTLATEAGEQAAPGGVGEVLYNLLMNIIVNPIQATASANYMGILFWSAILGLTLKGIASDTTKTFLSDLADAVSQGVRWIINLAPFGICGLVFASVSGNGLNIFVTYGKLVALLVGSMLVVSLIIDPLIVAVSLHVNPYPLVWRCLKESGVTAFFTRSSAANIPVNMALCEKLGLDKDMYSVSIPLGATINMDGAAITITIMTLAAAHTVGISVDIPTALILSVLAALAACGASGVAGGSLLLIPMACSLFGISNDVAMQVVGVGFIIGVIQDSVETALNSSGDVMFAATAEYYQWRKEGKPLPEFLTGKKNK
ncbi:MAG: serine/threonine transporter SstT [Lachnospiraceae bacterium]|nr:serine/threonine transporter SstT [Lachnospiraceae bacterium]